MVELNAKREFVTGSTYFRKEGIHMYKWISEIIWDRLKTAKSELFEGRTGSMSEVWG